MNVSRFISSQLSRLASAALTISLILPLLGQNPAQRPITKEGLLKAIQIGGLTSQELSNYIASLGVDFKLSEDDRSNLMKTGLDRSVIDVISNNYRAPEPPKPTEAEVEAGQVAQLSAGNPLTQDDLVGHLKSGVKPGVLERVVEKRGIQFAITRENAKTIETAGGTRSLLGALFLKQPALIEPVQNRAQVTQQVPGASTQLGATPQVQPPPVNPPSTSTNPPLSVPAVAASKSIIQATLVKREDLVYPALAKREKISGTVKCEVLIDEKGAVTKVKALSGHPVLAAAAEDSIRHWKYSPAKLDNKPVQSSTIVEVNFKPVTN